MSYLSARLRALADPCRYRRARSMYYSSRSDLLSDVKAFDACLAARNDGHAALRNFAEDNVSRSSPPRQSQS